IDEAEHNRPLMIEGYICGKKIKQIMIDNGSTVNLLPLSMIGKLGYRRFDLRPSGMMIQGFNQDGQRALGKITITMEVGELTTTVVCHVINAVTTYNLLLGRPWIHQYSIVPSTLHQCFKYCKDGIQCKVMADAKPYTEAESFFADASYYKGISEEEGKNDEKKILRDVR
ncbi:retropepsin-like aspartic protease, partial [Mycobacterium kansasii]